MMEDEIDTECIVKKELDNSSIEVPTDLSVNTDDNHIKEELHENDDDVQVPAPMLIKTEVNDTQTDEITDGTTELVKVEFSDQDNNLQIPDVPFTVKIQDGSLVKCEVYDEEADDYYQQDESSLDEDIQMKLEPIVNINDNVVPSCLIKVVTVNDLKDECASEEILSNIDNKCLLDEYKCDTSHLNSITGNMISLGEEAYHMLNNKTHKQCPKCPKLCTKSGYYRHLNVHKSIEKRKLGILKGLQTKKDKKLAKESATQCPKCPKLCTKSGYYRHLNAHKSIENRKFGILKGLQTRKDKKLAKELATQKVTKSRKKPKQTEVTIDIDIIFSFYCSKCCKGYNAKRSMLKHQRICKNRPTGTEGVAYCIISGKSYTTSLEQFQEHLKDCKECARNGLHDVEKTEESITVEKPKKIEEKKRFNKGDYLCPCGNAFQRRSRMETCLRSHNENPEIKDQICHSCIVCGKNFENKLDLMAHRKTHVKKKHQCKFCPTEYHTPKELIKHLKIHQKVQLMEYEVISAVVKGKQALNCFLCGKTWKELPELKWHILGEHKEPYICSICKQEFIKIIDLASHTKSAHPESESLEVVSIVEAFAKLAQSWKCEECELQFDQPDKLALHQAEQHSGKKVNSEPIVAEFQCPDCSRVFMTAKQLSSHRRIIHEDAVQDEVPEIATDPALMCIHCRKVCTDENALTSHMRLHSPERKYVCKFCDFRFATVEKRRSHALIHTGDMKYVCFICEYVCSSENRLNLHKQSVKHISMKEFLLNGVPLEPKPKEEKQNNENNASSTCSICGETFSSESKMLEHKQTHPFIEFPNEDEPSRIFFK